MSSPIPDYAHPGQRMANRPPLEFTTLAALQPKVGPALLHAHVFAAVIRLGSDPVSLPAGDAQRDVTVEWAGKAGAANTPERIGWTGLPDLADNCDSFRVTWNDNDTTEMAAIAVMALLVGHLEGGVVERVLQIGSGGDYYVLTAAGKDRDQVEVSGVREDGDGAETRRRTRRKTDQVLEHVRRGFVSVTAFSHPPAAGAKSCLHYVRRPRR